MAQEILTIKDSGESDYFYQEAINTLRTNVLLSGRDVKSIMVTSTVSGEGKSEISFELAKALAQTGKRVIHIDADMRKPAHVGSQKLQRDTPGLSLYLSGNAKIEDVLYHTNFQHLDIIPSGSVAPSPTLLLEDAFFPRTLKVLKTYYDYIIIDTPPIGTVIDAAVVAKSCDSSIFVVLSGETSYRFAKKALAQLELTECPVLGVVLNKVNYKKDKYYGKYSGKYYGKYYGRYYEENRENLKKEAAGSREKSKRNGKTAAKK